MRKRSQAVALCLTPAILLLCYVGLFQHYQASESDSIVLAEEEEWLRTSTSWGQRQKCRWLGFCGLGRWETESAHGDLRPAHVDEDEIMLEGASLHPYWLSGEDDSAKWGEAERLSREIPDYVLEYAPLVYLFSDEEYWPSDIAEHLEHLLPYLQYTPLNLEHGRENISHLAHLNKYGNLCGRNVFLQSDDDVETKPKWLTSRRNIPVKVNKTSLAAAFGAPHTSDERLPYRFNLEDDEEAMNASWAFAGGSSSPHAEELDCDKMDRDGEDIDVDSLARTFSKLGRAARQSQGSGAKAHTDGDDDDLTRPPFPPAKPAQPGRSGAPMFVIVADKGHGVVDAFWFFFYSYNLGNKVLNVRFGNHVGDWEHTAIRFYNGQPQAVFVSEHEFGDAYTYEAMEKIGKRPVVYSATGTHGMYVTPGLHPYVLPWGLLHDETDRGPLWDPTLNLQSYVLNTTSMKFYSSTLNPRAPTSWLDFTGRWGDKAYPLSDHRQYKFAGQAHYVSGPSGPRFKNLQRRWICQGRKSCRIKKVRANTNMRPWTGAGPGLEMSSETIRYMFGGTPDEEGDELGT